MLIRFANQARRYSLIIFCLISFSSTAQWRVGVLGGIASHSQKELKAYQQTLMADLPKGAGTTDEFPPYSFFGATINRQFERWTLGLEFGTGSSGGRVTYADYSGKITADQIVKYKYLAAVPGIILKKTDKWSLTGGAKVSLIWNKLRVENSLRLGNDKLTEKATFKADNIGLQPYLWYCRKLGKSMFVQATAGYEIQDQAPTKWTKDSKVFLDDGEGNPVHLQSNGFRFSVGIGLSL